MRRSTWIITCLTVLFLGVLLIFVALVLLAFRKKPAALNVLFIGNSFTSANSLPLIFQETATSAGFNRPLVSTSAPGGHTLYGHLYDPQTLHLLKSGTPAGKKWDAVILQEQSEIPAFAVIIPPLRKTYLANIVALSKLIRETNPQARIILWETWAYHPDFWSSTQMDTTLLGSNSQEMLYRLKNGTELAAAEVLKENKYSIDIARIGELWEINYRSAKPLRLHQADNIHPNLAGSYLTALGIFSTVYSVPAIKISYSAGLDKKTSEELKDLVTFNLPKLQKN